MFASATSIGLDIGHHCVRAVALRRAGRRWRIVGHAAVRRRGGSGEPRAVAAALGELDSLMRLGGEPTVAISDLATLVRYVATIPLPPDRLSRLLRLELLQHMEGGELAADTYPVPLVGDELIHCCVLAQPTQVYDALRELRVAGIAVGAIHFAPMAMYNATVVAPQVHDDEIALLVDIGAATTGVALFGERRLLACRQLPIGGDAFAAAAPAAAAKPSAAAVPASVPRPPVPAAPIPASPAPAAPPAPAEDDVAGAVAKDLAAGLLFADDDEPLVLSDDGSGSDDQGAGSPVDRPTTSSASGLMPFSDAPAEALEPTLPAPGMTTVSVGHQALGPELTKVAETLYAQLASSIAWFKTQIHARNLTVAKVFLVGGGAGLAGLDAYLERRFGVPVARLDPFVDMDGAAPEAPHEFATAVGLALGAAPGAVRLDLMPDGLLRQRAWRKRLAWPYVAAASLFLAAVLMGWALLAEQGVDQQSIEAYAAYQKSYDDQKAQLDALDHEKDELAEDLRAVASRLYAGRDLLYTIRALKERTADSKELWITRLETVDISQDAMVRDPASATRRIQSAPLPAKGARRDTAIDRGAVDITGSVKFDAAPTDTELNRFFEDYKAWIEAWKPASDAPRLFRDAKVIRHVIQHEDKDEKGKPKPVKNKEEVGRFPFQLRYFFQPTNLDDITSDRTAAVKPAARAAHAP